MSSNAETLANVMFEIERIIREYLEPTSAHDAKTAIELILLEMDRNDAIGAAERVRAGYTGPKLVK
jgi:hypothetical protein